MDAIIRQYGMDLVGNRCDQGFQECRRRCAAGLFDQLTKSELAGAVYGNEEIELAFGRLHLGNVDVEVADWIAPELRLRGFVAINVWEPTYIMPLQTAMQ